MTIIRCRESQTPAPPASKFLDRARQQTGNPVCRNVYEQHHHRWLLVITCAILQILVVDEKRLAETYPCLKSEATLVPDLGESVWRMPAF